MFEDSTFESTGRIHTHSRGWMLAAFFFNGSILLVLILVPLIYPDALPRVGIPFLMEAPPPPPPATPPPVKPQIAQASPARPELEAGHLLLPPKIPTGIFKPSAPEPPGDDTVATWNSDSGIPGSVSDVFRAHSASPVIRQAAQGPAHISSGVMDGQLIYKIAPRYPAIALEARVEGTIVLQATISKTGTIENLRVVSGPPMLQQAAIDAVKQWRYRPYVLDGQAVEVETTVNVVFSLNR
jgi:periplasmic protein TonB